MFGSKQAPYTLTAAALMAMQPILVSVSRNERGTFDYSVPASTMLSEVLKLVISAALLVSQRRREMATARRLMMESGVEVASGLLDERPMREFFRYMTPGAIYFVNNNLLFFILQSIDPTTFQLLSQMKTIFTGLLFWLFLKRHLTPVQWIALVTLACGTATSQLPSGHGRGRHAGGMALGGAALSMVSCLLSVGHIRQGAEQD